ncbi:uncharacterized mitochondrial protein-like protein [Tanacetum coccineum]
MDLFIDSSFSQNPKSSYDDESKPSSDDGKKVDEDPRKDSEYKDQEKEDNVNNTNNVNTVSSTVNVAGTIEANAVGGKTSIELSFDPNMPALDDDSIFDFLRDDEDDGVETDMNNLDTTIQVSPIPTTRIHKDHPLDQEEPKKVIHALKDPIWIEAMHEELLQFKLQEVWTLMDLPNGKRAIGSKWVFRNKKDERGIVIKEEVYVCQPPGFEDPDFPDRVYKVEKHCMDYIKLLDLGDILLVQVYVEDIIFGSTKNELCFAFEKLMHEKYQMSSMGELTFFLGLQVKQKKDGIFISQNKYFEEILMKFRFTEVKTASTLMETQKPLLKDEDGEEVDVYMYSSKTTANSIIEVEYVAASSCCGQVLWIQNQLLDYEYNFMHTKIFIDNNRKANKSVKLMMEKLFRMELKLMLVTQINPTIYISCIEQFWSTGVVKPINGEVQLHALVDGKKVIISEASVRRDLKLEDEEGVECFSGRVTPLFPAMVVQNQSKLGEGSAMPTDPHHTPAIIESSNQPQKTQKPRKPKRKDTQVPQPNGPTEHVADEAVHKELGDSLVRDATTPSSLDAEQDSGNITKTRSKATPNESSSLGTTSGGGPRRQETMGDTIAQTRFENVSKLSNDSLLTRGNTLRSDEDRLKLKELMELCTNLQQRVLGLEKTKTTQQNEIASLKRRVMKLGKKRSLRTHKIKRLYKVVLTARVESFGNEEDLGEDASKQGMRINAIDADEDITLVSVQDDSDKEMFDVNTLDGEEVFVAGQNENVVEEIVDAAQVSTAVTTATITTKEVTLAQALADLKSTKPKAKRIVLQGPDQLKLDEEMTLKLQAEIDEEERIARAEEEKIDEANIAWDDI